jgi:hypothetical protein
MNHNRRINRPLPVFNKLANAELSALYALPRKAYVFIRKPYYYCSITLFFTTETRNSPKYKGVIKYYGM